MRVRSCSSCGRRWCCRRCRRRSWWWAPGCRCRCPSRSTPAGRSCRCTRPPGRTERWPRPACRRWRRCRCPCCRRARSPGTGPPAPPCRPRAACTCPAWRRCRSGRCRSWCCPPQPQQTPLTQLPLMHWLAAVHAVPLALSAQLRLGAVPWQVNGAKQWESIEQLVRQAVAAADVGRAARRGRRRAGAAPVAVRDGGVRRAGAGRRAARDRGRGQLRRRRRRCRRRCCRTAGWACSGSSARGTDRDVGAVARAGADVARLAHPARAGAAADAVDAEVAGQALAGRRRTAGRGASCCRSGWSSDRRCSAPGSRRRCVQVPPARGRAVADVGRAGDAWSRSDRRRARCRCGRWSASTGRLGTTARRTTCWRRRDGRRPCRRRTRRCRSWARPGPSTGT